MKRPRPLKIISEITCSQCHKQVPTNYECVHDGLKTRETVTIQCECGYYYSATGSYTKGDE